MTWWVAAATGSIAVALAVKQPAPASLRHHEPARCMCSGHCYCNRLICRPGAAKFESTACKTYDGIRAAKCLQIDLSLSHGRSLAGVA